MLKTMHRGRPSSNAVTPILIEHERPEPPDYLSPEEAAEWEPIVARMPAESFPRELHPLLAAYCQHIVLAQQIMVQIRSFKVDMKSYKSLKTQSALHSMLIREHRAMSLIAMKLRLTPQSRHDTPSRSEIELQPTIRPSFQVDHAAA